MMKLVEKVREVVNGKSMFTVDGKATPGYTRYVLLAECADTIESLCCELDATRARLAEVERERDALKEYADAQERNERSLSKQIAQANAAEDAALSRLTECRAVVRAAVEVYEAEKRAISEMEAAPREGRAEAWKREMYLRERLRATASNLVSALSEDTKAWATGEEK